MKKRAYNLFYIIICAVYSVFLLAAGAVHLVFSSVPQSSARYVLSHCAVSVPERAHVSDSDTASDGDGEWVTAYRSAKTAGEETFIGSYDDVRLLFSTVFSNIFTRFRGIVYVKAGSELNGDTLSSSAGQRVEPVTELSSIPTDDIGYYSVELEYSGKRRRCILIVADPDAPALETSPKLLWAGERPVPEDFIVSASDSTALSFYFVTTPVCETDGETEFTLAAEDMGGNITEKTLICEVKTDVEPPVITGARDRHYFIGENVLYKDGVSVRDNRDGDNIALSIDISAVDPTAEGKYPVVYSATDSSGLSSEVTVTYTFEFTHEDAILNKIEGYTESISGSIIKDGMSDRQKAKAVYNWVRNNIGYVGKSYKNNWYESALDGFQTHRGDCYTYMAVSKALLTAAGLENIEVTREYTQRHANTHHYWNMVKIDGKWYHFDATPRIDHKTFFLLTTNELLKFSRSHGDSHLFDPSKYPKTP